MPHEASVAEHIYQWLRKKAFQAWRVGPALTLDLSKI